MREKFDKLPREEQDAVLNELGQMLLWRGWDRLRHGVSQIHACDGVNKIEDIFHRNGIEIEEYT